MKYVRCSVEPEELDRHIQSGKQCTRLILAWDDRISFVLTDGLELKRITLLDVIKEQEMSISGNDGACGSPKSAELGRYLELSNSAERKQKPYLSPTLHIRL
ncbi:recombination-associated protein RdgC [Paenalcaligenes sp. Me52]|uniref:recombination-associated protein RdgC n=1 Tax=Paenalcaligenes sp. Me52 TaxID=3392038 RepID=UPI003D281B57